MASDDIFFGIENDLWVENCGTQHEIPLFDLIASDTDEPGNIPHPSTSQLRSFFNKKGTIISIP